MLCYNIGCGKTFNIDQNTEKSCVYHKTQPIFHDGKKGWECCKRFTTDFSTCLNTPGCQVGYHNPEKPPEPIKQQIDPKYDVDVVVVNPIEKKVERPSGDEELIDLSIDVNRSLRTEIDKRLELSRAAAAALTSNCDDRSVPHGTVCKNAACNRKYESSETNKEICVYHSGEAIFHEGMKYWTCCLRKTSDFDAFMAQEGCSSGKHVWWKKSVNSSQRYDWFQSSSSVSVILYAKLVIPETVVIKANSIKLSIAFEFDCGNEKYEKMFDLFEEIDPNTSHVKINSSKIEILLKKKKSFNWNNFEFIKNQG